MRLSELIADLPVQVVRGSDQVELTDVFDDSRQVTPGSLFIARSGVEFDGRQFVMDAVVRGAAAVIREAGSGDNIRDDNSLEKQLPDHVAIAHAPRVDQALAGELAERFFGRPSEQLKLIGVTGTNGKTTTAYLAQYLLQQAGVATGLIGTIITDFGAAPGTGAPGTPAPGPATPGTTAAKAPANGSASAPAEMLHGRQIAQLTTPGAVDFSRYLAAMVRNGCRAAVAEVSSHALKQGRTAALKFDVAIFTNLTGDHLDYHGSMDDYATAKALLFDHLPATARAVVNADDPYGQRIVQNCPARINWTTLHEDNGDGLEAEDDRHTICRARVMALSADHSLARFDGPWGSVEAHLPLVGRHNVANALQALVAANAITPLARRLRRTLEQAPNVPGRLERIGARELGIKDAPAMPTVLVDYAHTHDALENVLLALRPVTRGRLIVLFGCGGDRDKTKRPKMAQVACKLADVVCLTSDNPRTEDPEAIIADILQGVPADRRDHVRIDSTRARAIEKCILDANVDDTVLLAGKGHEDYQIIGREKRHFDDREEAARALKKWLEKRKVGIRH